MVLSVKNIPLRQRPISRIFCGALLCISTSIHAGYKEDIGYTQLESEQGINTPDGSGVPVTQAEASTAGSGNPAVYLPDSGHSEFSGKMITDKSGSTTSTFSSHATSVGKTFYGDASSIAPGISLVDAFWADHWLQDGFLRLGGQKPLASSSRIANHSWVGDAEAPANSDLLRRTDWVVERDEFIQCIGLKNNASINKPLMSGAYNVIAVGKSDGINGIGTTAIDVDYVSGRTRPELVAPKSTSSSATPVVAASAALLIEHGQNHPGLSTDPVEVTTSNRNGNTIYNTGRTEVIKAVLMAGADRSTANTSAADITDYRVNPANQTTNGLDTRFGAGQVNVYNSFQIVNAGEQNSDEDFGEGYIGTEGFDYDPSFGGADGSNSTASYYFSTGANQTVLSATLAWNIKIDGGNGSSFSGSAELYDLDLNLYDITGGMVLLVSSSSSIDNTETIWVTLPENRNYKVEVERGSGQGTFNWDYALAWRMVELDSTDTDGDGIPDINDTDDDNDGLSDVDELTAGTDPLDPDTDNDFFPDGTEVLAGTNPLDISDFPEWGDINGDGTVNIADVLLATRAATGLITLNDGQLARGNVAPLVNGAPQSLPTDPFNAADLYLIQRKALGTVSF